MHLINSNDDTMAEGVINLGKDEFGREEQQEDEQNDDLDWDYHDDPNLDGQTQEMSYTVGQGLGTVELRKKLLCHRISDFRKYIEEETGFKPTFADLNKFELKKGGRLFAK